MALYVYSWLFHPVFGPARYTVFVAPAYLRAGRVGIEPIAAVGSLSARDRTGDYLLPGARSARHTTLSSRPTGVHSRQSSPRTDRLDPNRTHPRHRGFGRSRAQCRGRDGPLLPAGRLRRDRLCGRQGRAHAMLGTADLVYYARGGPISNDSGHPDSIGPFRLREVSAVSRPERLSFRSLIIASGRPAASLPASWTGSASA